jgi:hypothetical protein
MRSLLTNSRIHRGWRVAFGVKGVHPGLRPPAGAEHRLDRAGLIPDRAELIPEFRRRTRKIFPPLEKPSLILDGPLSCRQTKHNAT